MPLKLVNSWKAVGGFVKKFVHSSRSTKTDMKFVVYLPPQAEKSKVPALYWLSGLTCTEDNFTQKAGAFKAAAAEGVALVVPDTSPRGANIAGESDSWDFGVGAGFYVNATVPPWSENYRMYDYVTKELPALIEAELPIASTKSVFGHSMGGHGALIAYLKNPGVYKSVSAFSPITNPSQVPWGMKAFSGYLGSDNKKEWNEYDACHLLSEYKGPPAEILVDQGDADDFLKKDGVDQLRPNALIEAAAKSRSAVKVNLRMQPGYGHDYFFISTFIDDHIRFHASKLRE